MEFLCPEQPTASWMITEAILLVWLLPMLVSAITHIFLTEQVGRRVVTNAYRELPGWWRIIAMAGFAQFLLIRITAVITLLCIWLTSALGAPTTNVVALVIMAICCHVAVPVTHVALPMMKLR